MPPTLNISIAGIIFSVLSADKTTVITPPTDPAYNPFTLPPGRIGTDIRVTVYAEPESIPQPDKGTLIFEGGEAWRLFRCEAGYLLTLNLPGAPVPLWTIQANPAFTELSAHCHPSLIKMNNGCRTIPGPITYPLDQIILIHHLSCKKGVIVHCAGMDCNQRVSIFPGRSGAGKSAVARLLRPIAGVSVISDDRIVIRQSGQQFTAHGTPWPGEARIAVNRKADLGHIFFLTRATSNRVQPLTPDRALERLLPVASIPWYDENHLPGVLDFCDDLLQSTSAFDLHFTLENKLMDTLADFLPG